MAAFFVFEKEAEGNIYFIYREVCEKVEGQRVRGSKEERLGTYNLCENRKTAADEEICRPSAFAARTRKLSSCADGSWGFPPARVGRRWAPRSHYRVIGSGNSEINFDQPFISRNILSLKLLIAPHCSPIYFLKNFLFHMKDKGLFMYNERRKSERYSEGIQYAGKTTVSRGVGEIS